MGSRYLFIVLYVFLEHHLSRGDYRRPGARDARLRPHPGATAHKGPDGRARQAPMSEASQRGAAALATVRRRVREAAAAALRAAARAAVGGHAAHRGWAP